MDRIPRNAKYLIAQKCDIDIWGIGFPNFHILRIPISLLIFWVKIVTHLFLFVSINLKKNQCKSNILDSSHPYVRFYLSVFIVWFGYNVLYQFHNLQNKRNDIKSIQHCDERKFDDWYICIFWKADMIDGLSNTTMDIYHFNTTTQLYSKSSTSKKINEYLTQPWQWTDNILHIVISKL